MLLTPSKYMYRFGNIIVHPLAALDILATVLCMSRMPSAHPTDDGIKIYIGFDIVR